MLHHILITAILTITSLFYSSEYKDIEDPKILIWSAYVNRLNNIKLYETILNVQSRLSVVPHNKDMAFLLLETAATESCMGSYLYQLSKGPARGIFQVEPYTEKDTLNWLKKYRHTTYLELMIFYREEYDAEWNRTKNVPYQIALVSILYWRRCHNNLVNSISTRERRAKLWKAKFNTYKGKGTIQFYFERSNQYVGG